VKPKPKLTEKNKRNSTNKPRMSQNMTTSKEINSKSSFIDDIQNLIIKSKQKVQKDLDKIEKIDKNANTIDFKSKNNKNQNQNQKEDKDKKNNIKKELLKKSSERNIVKAKVNKNENNINKKQPLNKRYDTDLTLNKKANNLNKSKSKNESINMKSGYKKENEIISKKSSSQITANNNYVNNYIENKKNEIINNEKDS